jgi:hypothetical protein
MRRAGLCLLLLAGGAGCLRPFNLTEAMRREPVEKHAPAPASLPRTSITAEQVTTQNAHKMSQALLDEMDRDVNQEIASPAGGASRK